MHFNYFLNPKTLQKQKGGNKFSTIFPPFYADNLTGFLKSHEEQKSEI